MNLRGWKYEGRKISDKLHEQMLAVAEILNDINKVSGKNWPEMQKNIAKELGITTGQVRTIKRMMEEFDIIKRGSLSARNNIDSKLIYTQNGTIFIELMETEKLLRKNMNSYNRETIDEIDNIFKLHYQKVLANYSCNMNGNNLHPLRATLKAVDRYGYLTYWEWYLLNTIIQNDDNQEEEAELDRCIKEHRMGKLKFTETDIIENSLSHSYVLGNFKYAGLVLVEGTKFELRITINPQEHKVVEEIIK